MNPVTPEEIGKLSWYRKILRHVPHHCQYCGKMYVPCPSKEINFLISVPHIGYCCPDGHEGYIKKFVEYNDIKNFYSFMENLRKK